MNLGQKTEALISELEACASLLRSCSESHWAQWLEKSTAYLKKGQFIGVEHFEGAFGGMGSLNDLVLAPVNGHTLKESEMDSYNNRMRVHFDKAHNLIKEIRKNAVFS